MKRAELWVCHLGVVPYSDGVALQETLRARRQGGEVPDLLLLLEHPPTYTVGRRAGADELPFPQEFYAAKGIAVRPSDRGGRVTYHAPGQLVGYPIMGVQDVLRHVRTMESAIVAALAEEGLLAHARPKDGPDFTGVWVGPEGTAKVRKIASIGVHVQRGVSTHGFAVNVNDDLAPFDWVVACGLPGVRMTSLAAERPSQTDCGTELRCFRRRMAHAFASAHGRRQRLLSAARLGIDARGAQPIATAPSPEAVPA